MPGGSALRRFRDMGCVSAWGLSGNQSRDWLLDLVCKLEEADMPAKSKAQQKAAGAALAAKRGDIKKGELKGASKGMEKSMSEKQLEDFASTKRKGKPDHVAHH
ncbi:Protein of unknown function DUF3008 [Rhizobium sp. CF080]|nr:Protein of unknown function DUF3008 [Rhizobium sp. CF080]